MGYMFSWEYLEYLKKERDFIVINQMKCTGGRWNAETKPRFELGFCSSYCSFIFTRKWNKDVGIEEVVEGTLGRYHDKQAVSIQVLIWTFQFL